MLQSDLKADPHTTLHLLLRLSCINLCYPACICATHRSMVCQHLETPAPTEAAQSCTQNTQTHIPEGGHRAGNRKWSNLPQLVSEV